MLQYLIKFSLSLAVLYVFYRIVLRPLTFYQWNRFYLLCYSLVSFLIPFVNINPWIDKQTAEGNTLINLIPPIGNYNPGNYTTSGQNITDSEPFFLQRLTTADWIVMLFVIGAIFMFVRLLLQYTSLRRIRKSAVLLNENAGVQLYETRAPVGPFSFGNAIYINRQLHSEEELQRIIQHEFVHVKQKHTIDLMAGELLCVINWFNPFAWLIRYSIRQNLEFIADNNVVANGLDKKEYQYLLLKVVGIPQYSIASNFNFSNLKKRIAMMNKMKSTQLHLAKFLFVLPLLAVLLLAFRQQSIRKEADDTAKKINTHGNPKKPAVIAAITDDTIPVPSQPAIAAARFYNEKGYHISIADNTGECVVLVKDKTNKIVKAVTLEEWNKDKEKNETQYGEILPVPARQPNLPANVENITVHSNIDKRKGENTHTATVSLKDGSKEIYNLNDKKEKEQYIRKYGELPGAPPPPSIVPDVPGANPATPGFSVIADASPLSRPVPDVLASPLSTIRLRGFISNYPGNNPLIIVDGVEEPAGYDFNGINPYDIESITILKDKTAIDKYGDKARSGVIVITTKKNANQPHTLKDTLSNHPDKGTAVSQKIFDTDHLPNPASFTKQNLPNEEIVISADSIILNKNVLVLKGCVKMKGNQTEVKGRMNLTGSFDKMPLVIYNGKEVDDIHSFKIGKSRYRILSLNAKEAIAKYGDKARNGALEITRLETGI